MTETAFEAGRRFYREGQGVSDLWSCTSSDDDLPSVHAGYEYERDLTQSSLSPPVIPIKCPEPQRRHPAKSGSYEALELVAHTQASMKAHANAAARKMRDMAVKICREVFANWTDTCVEHRYAKHAARECAETIAALPIEDADVDQKPVAWYDKIKGMEVSVDVSTGEDDAHHRVFGRVDSVMLESCGAQEDIILVIEESRNYAAPVSAEAIRAEALEEAAKMCFSHGVKHESGTAFGLTAAIRGLK